MERKHEESADLIFQQNIKSSDDGRTLRMHCAICRKETTSHISVFGKKTALGRLHLSFNFCPRCGRYVCDDCFVVSDGFSIVGLCADCAQRSGQNNPSKTSGK